LIEEIPEYSSRDAFEMVYFFAGPKKEDLLERVSFERVTEGRAQSHVVC